MPLAKIHVLEGRYDQSRIAKVSGAIQSALMNTLRVPREDFFQLVFELPKNRFLHTPSFVGMHYSDDMIILEISFIQGRPKETRLALLKDINTRVAAAAGISPDDMMIALYEAPGENFSFVQDDAQRANAVAPAFFGIMTLSLPSRWTISIFIFAIAHAGNLAIIACDSLVAAGSEQR